MRRLRNPRRYRFKNLPDEHGLLFFAQRVEEALFEFSLDSYKAPALNTHTRCLELLRTLDEIEAGHVRAAALRSLAEELSASIARDNVARQLIGAAATELTSASWWRTDNVDEMRTQARFLQGFLWRRAYERALRAELLSLVPDGKSKERIAGATTALLTEWMALGFSHDYIFYVAKRFFWGIQGTVLSAKSLEEFFAIFDVTSRPFTVVVRTGSGWTPTASMLNPDLAELCTTAPGPKSALTKERTFLETPSGSFLLLKDIKALEPRSAVEQTLRRLRTLHSAVILQRHRDEVGWDAE